MLNEGVARRRAAGQRRGAFRVTVQGFFDVLIDTLIATALPAFRPRARVKEVAHPKPQRAGPMEVLPLPQFLSELSEGRLLR